jgi:hypothetical protein
MDMDSPSDFALTYQKMTDDEILQLASEGGFVDVAQNALQAELHRRNITSQQVAELHSNQEQEKVAKRATRAFSLKGTGLVFYGRRYMSESDREQNIQLRTKWFALVGFPIFPIASYRFAYTTRSKFKLWWNAQGTFVDQVPLQWSQVLTTWVKTIAYLSAVFLVFFLHDLWRAYHS